MRRFCRFLVIAAALAFLISLFSFSVSAEGEKKRVYDNEGIFNSSDNARIESALSDFVSETGIEIRVITTDDSPFYLSELGLSYQSDSAVLEIIAGGSEYYYEFYTYGSATEKIDDGEVSRILDDSDVYDYLKGGDFADGIEAFATLTARAYNGKLQEPMWLTVLVSAIIAVIVAAIPVIVITVKYKRKQKAPSYPLENYASLSLDADACRDSYMGSRIIKTRVNTSSGGGRSGGGRSGGSRGRR